MTARNWQASMRAFKKSTNGRLSFGRGKTTLLLPVIDDQMASRGFWHHGPRSVVFRMGAEIVGRHAEGAIAGHE